MGMRGIRRAASGLLLRKWLWGRPMVLQDAASHGYWQWLAKLQHARFNEMFCTPAPLMPCFGPSSTSAPCLLHPTHLPLCVDHAKQAANCEDVVCKAEERYRCWLWQTLQPSRVSGLGHQAS